ncbi:hypothetical protein GCM10025789_05020 [Tessaracoccus lubricantis]|uniref:NAD glycohydrolase translocation F5/8 type C domain-containing protein n=1 Tax=Tessaracoccus lubricantis TaxID=545543 RepID=A0ABP9F157_9ACTN
MTQDLPDDLFRQGADDGSDEVRREEPKEPLAHRRASVKTVPLEPRGMSPRVLAGLLVIALLAAFALGRLFVFRDGSPVVTVSPAPAATATPSSSPSSADLAYSGPVVVVAPQSADGQCLEGDSRDIPAMLLDDDAGTLWRCHGQGVGEQVRFTFGGRRQLVGVRVVNGNTAWSERYLAERRILSLRWEFDDGSYFVQGLAADNRNLQEVRFPPTQATGVTMTVLEVTAPGDGAANADAVSLSAVEFLTPA